MSIRDSSLKELIALAQQRLGTKAGGLKTRQQLIEALEATEKRKAPKVMVALSAPLPEVLKVIERGLPPEPMIWTGDAPLPQITAEVPVKVLPTERLVWSAQVIVRHSPEVPLPEAAHPSTALGMNGLSAEAAHPSTALGAALEMNGAFSSEEHVPQFTVPPASRPSPTVTRNFFVEPAPPGLPASYGDDRVLTFRRDPTTVYAAWDLAPVEHAEGRVVDRAGQTLQSFEVTAPSGGKFLATQPGEMKIELCANGAVVAQSAWVPTPTPPPAARNAASSAV